MNYSLFIMVIKEIVNGGEGATRSSPTVSEPRTLFKGFTAFRVRWVTNKMILLGTSKLKSKKCWLRVKNKLLLPCQQTLLS
jgi:hypothetical protein